MKIDEDIIRKIQDKLDADIYIYAGNINVAGVEKLLKLTKDPTHTNALLFLSTFGGDPHSAYKIAKRMQQKYENFIVYVSGFCKSAGTLIVLGSDILIMSDTGELGPLDTQIIEKGKFLQTSSLNISESITAIRSEVIKSISFTFNELANSLPLVHFKNPVENILNSATKVGCTFIESTIPLIDIERIGEIQRALKIAIHYGIKLISSGRGNINCDSQNVPDTSKIGQLTVFYPDHITVIDRDEAANILKNVCEPKEIHSDLEMLEYQLSSILNPSSLRDLDRNMHIEKLNKENNYGAKKSECLPVAEQVGSGKGKE